MTSPQFATSPCDLTHLTQFSTLGFGLPHQAHPPHLVPLLLGVWRLHRVPCFPSQVAVRLTLSHVQYPFTLSMSGTHIKAVMFLLVTANVKKQEKPLEPRRSRRPNIQRWNKFWQENFPQKTKTQMSLCDSLQVIGHSGLRTKIEERKRSRWENMILILKPFIFFFDFQVRWQG